MASKLGILAGGGPLPGYLIESCRTTGRDVFVIAFEGQADPDVVEAAPHAWVRLGAAGTALDHLRQEGVEEIVMAGPVRRPTLRELRPDRRAARFRCRGIPPALRYPAARHDLGAANGRGIRGQPRRQERPIAGRR